MGNLEASNERKKKKKKLQLKEKLLDEHPGGKQVFVGENQIRAYRRDALRAGGGTPVELIGEKVEIYEEKGKWRG